MEDAAAREAGLFVPAALALEEHPAVGSQRQAPAARKAEYAAGARVEEAHAAAAFAQERDEEAPQGRRPGARAGAAVDTTAHAVLDREHERAWAEMCVAAVSTRGATE